MQPIPRQQCSSYASWRKTSQRIRLIRGGDQSVQLLPRETYISSEKLRYLASFAFAERPDGKWTAKLDRKTLFREPIDGRPFLAQITCPTLLVRAQHSPLLSMTKSTGW